MPRPDQLALPSPDGLPGPATMRAAALRLIDAGVRDTPGIAAEVLRELAPAAGCELTMADGRLAGLGGGPARFELIPGVQLSDEDLQVATPEQVAQALKDGLLKSLLDGSEPQDRQMSADEYDAADDDTRDSAYEAGVLQDLIDSGHVVVLDDTDDDPYGGAAA
jgi:hypothetical protein